jgi:1-deoxyxylulose-5-phosphate synthase
VYGGEEMRYRQLGFSDLSVSEIALGSWLTYGVGVDRDQAMACVKRAFDVGINFLDTANVYGRGAAESFLGEALVGIDRHSYVLATKEPLKNPVFRRARE